MGIVLALVLVAPVVGVQTDGMAPCDSDAFARDLRALRPELEIMPLRDASTNAQVTAPADAWVASIEAVSSDQPLLRVTGNPTPLVRPLPGQDCKRVVEIAASIVDGLLDQLPNPARDIGSFEAVTGARPSLSAWLGAGTLQGPIQWVASLALGARVGLRSFEIVGSADIGLPPASISLATVDYGTVGRYQAIPIDLEVGGGWSPRLGPGRLSLDGFVGLALVNVAELPKKGAQLFDAGIQTATELFFAAAAGYSMELPARLFVGLRLEERWAPVQATVAVDTQQSGDQVNTRRWTFTSTVIVGWRFF